MRILILDQTFYPDVVSVAQHAADLARRLVECGHDVSAIASRRAYDSPDVTFPGRELWMGIKIRRVWSSGFGKSAPWRRALDFATFILSCASRLLFTTRQDVVIAMTAPPLISFIATLFVALRGGRLVYWVMDLNPDQAIAAGLLSKESFVARLLERLSRLSLNRADTIIALDRFMAERIAAKGIAPDKVMVIPVWSHSGAVQYSVQGRRDFRREHRLGGKFVVMHSGNHCRWHPLNTLLDAALELRGRSDITFCFTGGGTEFQTVKTFAAFHGLKNIVCVPYQPLEKLAAMLSSADLHVVLFGDPFVGILHPCKVYNILTLGIPLLYVGPEDSHITRLVPSAALGRDILSARHGDKAAVVAHIERSSSRGASRSTLLRETAAQFSEPALWPAMREAIEGPAARQVEACRAG